jgi:hypothetical protein
LDQAALYDVVHVEGSRWQRIEKEYRGAGILTLDDHESLIQEREQKEGEGKREKESRERIGTEAAF